MAGTALEILAGARTIALVGASPRPERPSNSVMRYLLDRGYRVIPVRPVGPVEIHGVRRVAALSEIEEPIDLVDVFRRADACPGVAREAVEAGAKAVWLQLGLEFGFRNRLRRSRLGSGRPLGSVQHDACAPPSIVVSHQGVWS